MKKISFFERVGKSWRGPAFWLL